MTLGTVACRDACVGVNRVGPVHQLRDGFGKSAVCSRSYASENGSSKANRFRAAHLMEAASGKRSAQL